MDFERFRQHCVKKKMKEKDFPEREVGIRVFPSSKTKKKVRLGQNMLDKDIMG